MLRVGRSLGRRRSLLTGRVRGALEAPRRAQGRNGGRRRANMVGASDHAGGGGGGDARRRRDEGWLNNERMNVVCVKDEVEELSWH